MSTSNEEDDGRSRPSKSQLKRDSQALQQLAAELVALPREQLGALPLPEEVSDAVTLAVSIRQHGARKRQIKHIGGLLRGLDVEPIREGLGILRSQNVRQARAHQRLERWRDSLINGGDRALGMFLDEWPNADTQRLRQLVRAARKEHEDGRSPVSARLLFKYLRALLETRS